MSEAVDADKIKWAKLHEAAADLGIDISTLPSRGSMSARQKASEPNPEPEPQLDAPVLSDDEWAALAQLMPAKSKYLSRLAPRDFLDAALFWVWCGRKFVLVPTPSIEQFRAKLYRSFGSGLFAALNRNSPGSLDSETKKLLSELADAERVYVKRSEEFRAARLKKLAREKVSAKSRGG